MKGTLKRLSLVDASNVKGERISKNAQLNILGGYKDDFTWCMVYGENCHHSPLLGYFACDTGDVSACWSRCVAEAPLQHTEVSYVCCVCGVDNDE